MDYSYNGNQLTKVDDTSVNVEGFKDGNTSGNDYAYDENGNMISDKNKNITKISYNHLNLPKQIEFGAGGVDGKFMYIYDATGVKLEKKVAQTVNATSSLTTTVYAGNFNYVNNDLQFISHPEGYVEDTQDTSKPFIYFYQLKDHLGNIRVSFNDTDKDGKIDVRRGTVDIDGDGDLKNELVEEHNYYPYGLKHKGYNNVVNGRLHKDRYNGKEFQDELNLNWHDYGARNYNPALGRWMNLDPLAENYPTCNPYEYAFNNPMAFFDPDGMENIIYVVYTNDDEDGQKEVDNMIEKANKLLKEYGLETRLVSFSSDNNIDRDNLDETDSIVLIGDEENVKAYDRKNNLSGDWLSNREEKKGWRTDDDGYNPELTRQGENRISYVTSDLSEDRLLLFTLHGIGHQKRKISKYDDHVYGSRIILI